MEHKNTARFATPENPYAMVGSGSIFFPESLESESKQTKAGVVSCAFGTALILTSAMTYGMSVDNEIQDSEIRRGLSSYRPLTLDQNAQIIDQTLIGEETEELHSVQHQINTIVKSLNPGGMSGLATMLHVSRPTIYKWLEEKGDIKPENQDRLASLFNLAEYWNDLSSESLKQGLIKRRLPSGTTLFEILTEAELSIGEAKNAIEVLAKSQNRSLDALNRFKVAISSD